MAESCDGNYEDEDDSSSGNNVSDDDSSFKKFRQKYPTLLKYLKAENYK